MDNEKVAEKSPIFYVCNRCDYKCSKRSDWNKHQLTRKHKMDNMDNEKSPKVAKKFLCSCGKEYKYASGLCKHKKKCNVVTFTLDNNSDIENEVSACSMSKDELINKLLKDNEEMRNIMKDQCDTMKEMIPKLGNTTNNKFNLNLFLNEQCKDALNINDFIESLTIQIEDLEKTKDCGLIEGISSVFVNGLKQLDMYKRPIHCTDIKRETLYIKDANAWEKDDKTKIKKSINDIANKKRKAIQEWTDAHPNWVDDECLQQEYLILVNTVMGNVDENNIENKIIRNIAKEVIIDK